MLLPFHIYICKIGAPQTNPTHRPHLILHHPSASVFGPIIIIIILAIGGAANWQTVQPPDIPAIVYINLI